MSSLSIYMAEHLTSSQVELGIIITGIVFVSSFIGLVYCSVMLIIGRK